MSQLRSFSLNAFRRRFIGRAVLLLGDMSMVAIGYSLAYFLRFTYEPFLVSFPVTKGIPAFSTYVRAGVVILPVWVLALSWQGNYQRFQIQAIDEAIRVLKGSLVGAFMAMSAMFLYRESSFSRIVFILGAVFSAGFIYALREALKIAYVSWVRRNRRPRRVLILGNGYLSESLQKILDRHRDRATIRRDTADPKIIQRTILRSRIDEVLLANPEIKHQPAIELANFCEEQGVSFRLLPDILEMRMGEIVIDESLGLPMIQIKPLSLHGTAFLTKRILDVLVASAVLGILFLPLVLVALLIRLTSPGPIFYRQPRVGHLGKQFEFLKFRTMVLNADAMLAQLRTKSDRLGPVFKMKQDPRITAIGSFLRRFSIDEVPQFLNVLKGDMSLVGPRPQVVWEAKTYDSWAKKRLNVLPGITGLWQVSGRAELTYQEMIDLDIYYIEHWSLGLDVKIMLKTLPAVLLGKGAY